MKVAITSQGVGPDSGIDPRFGRTKFFIIVDTETNELSVTNNVQNLNAAQGAGIQAGKLIVGLGVEAVITGHVGPKAFATLQAGGVDIYSGVTGTVAEALERFKAGALTSTDGADVDGHWG